MTRRPMLGWHTVPMEQPSDAQLERAARRYRRDMSEASAARRELATLVRAALAGGRSVNATATATGLSRVQIRRMRDGEQVGDA